MKTFAVRYSFIKHDDNDLIGGTETNRHKQGTMFINAKTKKDALAKMEVLGYRVRPGECRVGSGTDMDALLGAGIINDESLVLLPDNRPYHVARVWLDENGERHAARIGEVDNDREAATYSYKFIPAES